MSEAEETVEEVQFKATLKAMIHAQAFVIVMDTINLNPLYKKRIRQRGKTFIKSLDELLNAAYGDMGQDEMNMLEIMEMCDKAIDEIFKKHLTVV